jgi:Ca-activated chloride channel family protein
VKKEKSIAILIVLTMTLNVLAQSQLPANRGDWRTLLDVARKYYQAKDYQNALLYYKSVLPSLPKDIDVSSEIAQTQYRLNQFDAAGDIYNKKQKPDASNINMNYNSGNVAMKKQQFNEAIEQYKTVLRKNPQDTEARYNLSEAIRKKDQQDQQDKQQNQSQNPQKPKDQNKDENNSSSKLNERSVDRMLDNIMKQEAQTKRKIANGKEGPATKNTEKDW